MKSCLIIGGYALIARLLIDRLDKEGWKVSTLEPDGVPRKNRHIFEQYVYDYESESVSGVIESIRPDVIVFTGAYDMNYIGSSQKIRENTRRYLNGLSNLLICAGRLGVRNFLYLSSDEIFKESYITDIAEDMPPSPETYREMVVFQGEAIARRYSSVSSMEVTVARVGRLYCMPENASECVDVCTSMCLSAVRGQTLKANSRRVFSALYASDAAEALYRLVSAPSRKCDLYHIASAEEISEMTLARLIQENTTHPVTIEDVTTGLRERRILSAERFNREFGFKPRVSCESIFPEIINRMQTRMSDFQIEDGGSGKGSPLRRALHGAAAYVEALLCCVLCYFLTLLLSGAAELQSINVFLLYVLLFASFYGSRIGILSAFLASACYCVMQGLQRTGLELLLDINTYLWIVQMFAVALIAGFVRDRLVQNQQDTRDEVQFLTARLDDVGRINDSNVRIKNFFEERVVDSNESVGYIYSIISKLDAAENGAVLFAATDTLMQLINTTDVAIYRMLPNGFLRLVSSTSEQSRSLGKSVHFSEFDELFNTLQEKHVYVNRRLDPALPHLIGTLRDVDDHISFIVMLWNVKYDHMTQYHINLLSVICQLISNAVTRSVSYLEAVASQRFIEGTAILRQSEFENLYRIYHDASQNRLTEFCLLEIQIDGGELSTWSDRVRALLRFTDHIGLVDGKLYILLTNTNLNDSVIVQKRLAASGIEASIAADLPR